MRPSPGIPAPSKQLLRYLKSRTDRFQPSLCISQCAAASPLTRQPRRCQSTSSTTTLTTRHEYEQVLGYYDARRSPPLSSQRSRHSHVRHASTNSQPSAQQSRVMSFWSRLRKGSRKDPRNEQNSRSAGPDETSASLFNLSRALARSPTASDLKLRCTEFDANGSVTLVSGEFRKSELIAKYGLQPRDLRKIDSSVLPHILVRPSAVLINLLHLRVLIQSDRVLVFDAYGSTDSYTQSLFMYDLEGKLRQKPDPRNTSTYLPYEFRALEAVLISVTSGLEAEFALVRDPVTHILAELEQDIDRDKLRHLLIHSKKLGTFEQKARLVRDAINDLLEADDDLAAMYLTERRQSGKPREEDDHQEIEMLLESYHKICDEIVEISGNLISNIRNTEEVVKAILDANRNQLMLLEIKFSVGTLGLAGGTLIAGLYGMNLNNFIEETDWGFGLVSVTSFVLSGVICIYGMRKLRKVQRVRMWGEGVDVLAPNQKPPRQFLGMGRSTWKPEAMESQAWKERLAALKQRDWSQQQSQAQSWNSYQQYNQPGNYSTQQPWGQGPSTAGAGPASGPVLWPGMDGLGMHKLNNNVNDPSGTSSTTTSGGQVDEETGHGYTQPQSQASSDQNQSDSSYEFRIHDDLENTEQRMNEERAKQRGIAVRGKQNPGKGD